jgi:hypothetical protein
MQMGQKPLPFTEEDLHLIRNGLARRTETGTMLAARLLPINTGRK